MRRFRYYVLLAAIYSLLLSLSTHLPWWITIPLGIAVTAIVVRQRMSDHARRIETIQKRLTNLKSEGMVIDDTVPGTEGDVFYRMILTLLTDLERSLFKMVEKNIQLLSLKEIGRSIVSSLDEKKLINSVFEYLIHGAGYKEVAFLILRKPSRAFQAIVSIERATKVIRRTVNVGFDELDGAVYNSFISRKPFLIKDIAMHPLMDVGREPLFPGSTMTSYICVPLMKSVEEVQCSQITDCTVKKLANGENSDFDDIIFRSEECLACPHLPVLGALVVTDGYRASPLTNIDQVTMETLGTLISSNIENWMLYQELRQEELFREKVIEGMINGVFVVDLEGAVTLANKTARDISDLSENELTGMSIDRLIIDESGEDSRSPVLRVLHDATPLMHYEAYLKRSNGLHVPIRMNVSRLVGENSRLQGAIIEFVDQSDIKRMENEIRHLDRLAVLGRFTSAVAHEIRNPLTGIAAGIQYLNRDRLLPGAQRENIAFILNEVERLNRIITDLFKVAKPRDLLYQEAKVADLIDRASKSLSELMNEKKVDFHVDIADNLPLIEVDPDQIVQVIINLIKNAVEAVPEGGEVRIRTHVYEGGDVEVIREKDRDMICIEVTDSGAGIDAGDREKIFEPFYSKKRGGTGLGLFITHNIIQHHQGRITIPADQEHGAVLRVYLPIGRAKKGEEIEAGRSTG
jgi:PAS domain S-box-containing protein